LSAEDLMDEEAKKAFEKAMSERREFVAQRALWRALGDDRKKAEASDVREALKELEPKKIRRHSLIVQVVAFFISLGVFELITNGLAYFFIENYFTPITAEKYSAVGALFAAAISAGVGLCVAFYRFILRDRL
jgi:hypothetical protein